jgi:hypothetical protein
MCKRVLYTLEKKPCFWKATGSNRKKGFFRFQESDHELHTCENYSWSVFILVLSVAFCHWTMVNSTTFMTHLVWFNMTIDKRGKTVKRILWHQISTRYIHSKDLFVCVCVCVCVCVEKNNNSFKEKNNSRNSYTTVHVCFWTSDTVYRCSGYTDMHMSISNGAQSVDRTKKTPRIRGSKYRCPCNMTKLWGLNFVMFRPIRVDHTDFFQVPIKTLQ